jgi:hypothetical protein
MMVRSLVSLGTHDDRRKVTSAGRHFLSVGGEQDRFPVRVEHDCFPVHGELVEP